MRIKPTRKAVFSLIFLIFCGILGGFVGGLLGAGGGVIITLALGRLLPKDEESRRSVFASALCVTLPLSILTLTRYAYSTEGGLSALFSSSSALGSEVGAELIFIAAIVGGVLGGVLLGKLRSAVLSRIFAALCAVSGILMII